MKDKDLEYIRDLMDNITYWDTCPEDYKERFRVIINQINDQLNKSDIKSTEVALNNLGQDVKIIKQL